MKGPIGVQPNPSKTAALSASAIAANKVVNLNSFQLFCFVCLLVSVSVCLSVCLFDCLFVCLFVCLLVCLFDCLFV